MRKRVVGAAEREAAAAAAKEGGRTLDLASIATVEVTSESPEHPIENAFDGQRATQWRAAGHGEQAVTLVFDAPQRIDAVTIEVDDADQERTQEIALDASKDGGASWQNLRRQEFGFSPRGATSERETWELHVDAVTHLRLSIRPDKGGGPHVARLTTFACR